MDVETMSCVYEEVRVISQLVLFTFVESKLFLKSMKILDFLEKYFPEAWVDDSLSTWSFD